MKSILTFLSASILISVMAACSNDDNSVSNTDPSELSSNLQSGMWFISYYYDRDEEKTSDFAGFVFEFRADKNLVATKGTEKVSGTWGTRKDSGKTKLGITFSGQNKFEEISEDWEIKSQSVSRIELIHISGGDGHQDLLTFERK